MGARPQDLHTRGVAFGFYVFLAIAFALTFPYFEDTRNANERPRLMQGMAIVDGGHFAIDGPAVRRLDPGPDVARSEVDGRRYPNKPPGTSLVAAVGYTIARAWHGDELDLRKYTFWVRLLSGALPSLLLCIFLTRRLWRTFGRGPALAAVTLYAVATPALSYAHLAYGHQLAAALLMVGIPVMVDAVLAPQPGWGKAALGGGMCGAAVGVEYGAVFAAVPIGAWLLWGVRRDPGRIGVTVAAVVGALVPVALLAAYHDAVFGSPWSTGYHHVTNPEFVAKHGEGLLGLGWPSWGGFFTHFLDPGGGLLWWVPLAPLCVYGLARLATAPATEGGVTLRAEARIYLGLAIVYALVASSLSFDGGWRVGPRYLVAILPIVALGMAEVAGHVRTAPAWLGTVLALGIFAAVINALAANLWPHLDLTNVHHPVGEVLIPLWEKNLEPYSVSASIVGISPLQLAVVLCVVGVALALIRVVEVTPSMIAAVAVGAVGGFALVFATLLWPPHPKAERNLAYIVHVWEPHPGAQEPKPSHMLRPLPQGTQFEPAPPR